MTIAPPAGSHAVILVGETLWLTPERTAFWPRKQTLLVADLHLGKSAAFRAAAFPVPEATTEADLSRLSHSIRRMNAERLVILGDLLHARSGQTPRTIEAVTNWRKEHPKLQIVLVLGNHDKRCGVIPLEWQMEVVEDSMKEQPFVWRHRPDENDPGYVVAGHVHPVAVLHGSGRQKLRLRCFAVGERRLILPAFGSFTGGATASPPSDYQIYVVADDQVVEAPKSKRR